MSKLSPWKPLSRSSAVVGPRESENPPEDPPDQVEQDEDSPQSRAKRLVLRTKDFGKSIGGVAQSPSSPNRPSGEHKRMFSLSRKGKGIDQSEGNIGVAFGQIVLTLTVPSVNYI